MGLESSIPEARLWIKSGSSLLSATPQEIDKELNIKVFYDNPCLIYATDNLSKHYSTKINTNY